MICPDNAPGGTYLAPLLPRTTFPASAGFLAGYSPGWPDPIRRVFTGGDGRIGSIPVEFRCCCGTGRPNMAARLPVRRTSGERSRSDGQRERTGVAFQFGDGMIL